MRIEAQHPQTDHLCSLEAVSPGVCQVVILTLLGAGKPQQVWAPKLALTPWQALLSPHDPLHFLPSISLGGMDGWAGFPGLEFLPGRVP